MTGLPGTSSIDSTETEAGAPVPSLADTEADFLAQMAAFQTDLSQLSEASETEKAYQWRAAQITLSRASQILDRLNALINDTTAADHAAALALDIRLSKALYSAPPNASGAPAELTAPQWQNPPFTLFQTDPYDLTHFPLRFLDPSAARLGGGERPRH